MCYLQTLLPNIRSRLCVLCVTRNKGGSSIENKDVIRGRVFNLSYWPTRRDVISYYHEFARTPPQYERLLELQTDQLKRLILFAYAQIPYYRQLFDSIGLQPGDISSIKSLERIPLLNKRLIRESAEGIVALKTKKNVIRSSTGGSTGEPLKYLMSMDDYLRGIALLYRGWGYGGYCLGDRVAIVAGASLIPTVRPDIRRWIISRLRNHRYYSSYGMSADTLARYVEDLRRFKPHYIRGYASSIYLLAEYMRSENLDAGFRPRGIFTTAEQLVERHRLVIEEVFRAKVFNNYGLHDGGVSAYECREHRGMHIDMERSILEVVDDTGKQVIGKPGRILATSLYNYALPFIRYDTGDIGVMSFAKCSCGRELPLLEEIVGRTTDVIELNGRKIGSPVLTVLFGKVDIRQYQIVQDSENSLLCRIVKGPTYSSSDEQFINKSLLSHVGTVRVAFDYVSSIPPEGGGKHKFIINNANRV